jgi:hypothetical protein
MIFQYSLFLNINIPGRKIFHVYYYKLNVPHTKRAYSIVIIAAYCYNIVTVLPKYRNNNFFFRLILLLKR